MKAQTFIAAVLIVLSSIHFLPVNKIEAQSDSIQKFTGNTITDFNRGYNYERVLKDGIWYIYVYDNGTLVDIYPE